MPEQPHGDPEKVPAASYWFCTCGEKNHVSLLVCPQCSSHHSNQREFFRDDLKKTIQDMRLHNETVHNAFQCQQATGISYEHTLEMLVIALAERGDTLRNVLMDYLKNAPPPPIYLKKAGP